MVCLLLFIDCDVNKSRPCHVAKVNKAKAKGAGRFGSGPRGGGGGGRVGGVGRGGGGGGSACLPESCSMKKSEIIQKFFFLKIWFYDRIK